jgi:hypothetical protein
MDPQLLKELKQFEAEKREALLSLDEEKIRAFTRKWNDEELPDNPTVFWGSIHKAITGTPSLPIEHRRKSKKWLDDHGMHSLDDGDLLTP